MASQSQNALIGEAVRRLQDSYESLSKATNPVQIVQAKAQLRSIALELAAANQPPQQAGTAFAMGNAIHPCFRAAADCGIVAPWPKETMTSQELAEKTGADARLIARLMRMLTASGCFKEVGEETYAQNALSVSAASHVSMMKFMSPGVARLPEYLAATSYINPGTTTGTSTLFQYGNNTPLTFYQALAKDDKARSGFDNQMAKAVMMERSESPTGFAAIYDFEGELGSSISSDEGVVLVDVGGSQGHVLEDVKKHLPNLKGRLVLEEIPETLASVTIPEGIEALPYNFLESEQPIKGAACYLFRQIFLNWSDVNGKLILKNMLPALKKGQSRVLIMEPVLPPVGAPLQAAMMDIQMMQMSGGLRTEKQWREFLCKAGYEVGRFLKSKSVYTVIEAFPMN